MANDLLAAAALLWIAGGILALTGRWLGLVRVLLALGSLAGIVAAIGSLPDGTAATAIPLRMADAQATFQMTPAGLVADGLRPGSCIARLLARARRRSPDARVGCSARHAACWARSACSAFSTAASSCSPGN